MVVRGRVDGVEVVHVEGTLLCSVIYVGSCSPRLAARKTLETLSLESHAAGLQSVVCRTIVDQSDIGQDSSGPRRVVQFKCHERCPENRILAIELLKSQLDLMSSSSPGAIDRECSRRERDRSRHDRSRERSRRDRSQSSDRLRRRRPPVPALNQRMMMTPRCG